MPRPRGGGLSCGVTDDPIFPLKRQLADAILVISATVSELAAARRFGIDPARVRDLRHGRIARFSVERLIRLLATVDCPVTLTVSLPHPRRIDWYPELRAKREAYLAARRAAEGR